MFQVIASPRARKSLKKLAERYRQRIIELLLIFRENPVPAEYTTSRSSKDAQTPIEQESAIFV